jgi:DNA polymerase III gamma/tau subunit
MAYQKSNFAFQIFIIQDIERMTRESANACLKLFEEP